MKVVGERTTRRNQNETIGKLQTIYTTEIAKKPIQEVTKTNQGNLDQIVTRGLAKRFQKVLPITPKAIRKPRLAKCKKYLGWERINCVYLATVSIRHDTHLT
jgi:hypothetical protein